MLLSLLLGVSKENAQLLQWRVFLLSSTRSVHFFFVRSASSTWTADVQNILETPEPRPKRKHQRPKPQKHRILPFGVFHSDFFGTMRLFLNFFNSTKGIPIFCFDILQHNGCQETPKGLPFTLFDTVTLFKNLNLFFLELFKNLPRVPN